MKWKIGNLEIKNQVVVAPMAGVTNLAYRNILKEFGAGLIYTEMISDKGLLYENNKTQDMTEILDEEKPVTLQLFGSEVETMKQAAMYIDKCTNCDVIDINMGCPVTKVVKSGAGSKLMTNENLAYEITKAVVDHVSKPVTVKIRTGWDHKNKNAVSLAKKLESAGISALAIHGRTRSDMYTGKADLDIIKEVKSALKIPVIGNGDIRTPEDALHMLEYTGCDAVMIGRGILGNPFLIEQTVSYLERGKYDYKVDLKNRKEYMLKHMEKLIRLKGEHIAVLEMRSHGPWYIKGLKNASHTKQRLVSAGSIEEVKIIIDEYFESLQ